jgi:3-hydroxyisobutyrate dehydrogenase-like beta-hydroxyacid dehydrogenase
MVDIGFIGLGHMGFPMARRLIDAGHDVIALDTRTEALDRLVALGARRASSPKGVADVAETVMASLPSPHAAVEVATGADGVVEGSRVRRYVDLSTIGSSTAAQIHDVLARWCLHHAANSASSSRSWKHLADRCMWASGLVRRRR